MIKLRSEVIMTKSIKVRLTMLATTAAFLLAAGGAFAQERSTAPATSNPAMAPAAASHENIDDATLKQTAKAYVKVRQIVDQSKQDLRSNGSSDSQKQETAKMLESKKLAAVKAEGLEPQQYNHVIEVVQVDTNLQQKFLSYVKEAGGVAD
jgi:hypothetical protein